MKVEDIPDKVKAVNDCISKCATDNTGDLKVISKCSQGCTLGTYGDGVFAFKVDATVDNVPVDLDDLPNKAKAAAECALKCTADNNSDLNALLECYKGCSNK